MHRHTFATREIKSYGSSGVDMTFLVGRADTSVNSVNVAHMDLGGGLGRHEAASWQVFLVLTGRVRVTSGPPESAVTLTGGEAVQWQPGESHESTAIEPSIVIVMEGPDRFVDATGDPDEKPADNGGVGEACMSECSHLAPS